MNIFLEKNLVINENRFNFVARTGNLRIITCLQIYMSLKTQITAAQSATRLPVKPSDLPAAIATEVSRVTGDVWQVRYFFSTLPCLAAYGDRLRGRYAFGDEVHAANNYVFVVGPSASGKGFLRSLYQELMYLFCDASDQERNLEEEYRQKMRAGGKGPKPDNPHSCIREFTGSISQAAIQQSAANCMDRYGDALSFFYFTEEATSLAKSNRVNFSDMSEIMRLGFDFGTRFGNTRAHTDCSARTVCIRMSALMSSTYSGMRQLFTPREADQGSTLRYIFLELDDPIDAPPSETRQITEEEKNRLDKVLRTLMAETFTEEGKLQPEVWLDMSWLYPDVKKWCDAAQKRAEELRSIPYRNSSRRASVIAFRASMLLYHLYHLDNQLFDDINRDEEWIRKKVKIMYKWMASYILESGYRLFGEEMERELENATKGRNFKELLDFLPAQFSRQQLVDISQAQGYTNKVSVRLSQWKKEGKIKEIGKKLYQKNTHL